MTSWSSAAVPAVTRPRCTARPRASTSRMIENNKVGGTCLHVGCIPAKELLETAATYRHVASAKEFGIIAAQPERRLVRDAGAQAESHRPARQGAARPAEGPQGHRARRARHGSRPNRTVSVSGGESGDVELTGDAVIIASGSVARTIPGFDVDGKLVVTSDEFLSMTKLPGSAAVDRRRRDRLRVRVDDERPRHQGHDARGAAEDPSGRRQRRHRRGAEVVQASAASRCAPASRSRVTSRTGARHDRQFGDGSTIDVDVVVVSVGRQPNTDDLGLDGDGVKIDERGFVQVDERCRTGEDGSLGGGRLHRHAAARARRLRRGDRRDQGHPRREPGAGRLRQGALVHLLPPGGRVRRATPSRPRRTPGSTSSRPSTASSATAAP